MAAVLETAPPARAFDLAAEHELRFEIPHDCTTATLTLQSGSAEIFGVELALSRAHALPPSFNAAAFTWFGARLSLVAPAVALAYTATDTPMPTYIRAHAVLQARRDAARNAGRPGPRALIVGPPDAGKSALANILTAYAVKANASCVLVDLDPSASGAIAVVPGAFAVSIITHLDIEEGGPMHERLSATMYGHVGARGNLPVVQRVMSSVGDVLDAVMSEPKNMPHAGCVIDMCGDVDGSDGLELVLASAKAAGADVVFVLGGERLFASVRSRLATDAPETEVVLLPKSGGVVSRNSASRQRMRSRRTKEYFYGSDNLLNPFSTVVDFSSVTILQVVGETTVVPDSLLPIGAESTLDPLQPATVPLSRDLLHAVLGVSQADVEEDVLKKPVFGFVHVSKVDLERNTFTVLAPSPGRIPGKFLLLGSVKWME